MNWFKENAAEFSGQLQFDSPLKQHSYYRIGGPAALVATPESEADLRWLDRGVEQVGCPVAFIGRGSNLLAHDDGFSGLVVKTTKMNMEEVEKDGELVVGASVPVVGLLRRAGSNGWAGLEFLTGVPGTVGGAVFMNAGTHLGEAKDRLLAVKTYRLGHGFEEFKGDELKFEYRKNDFIAANSVVWSATWRVDSVEPSQVASTIKDVLDRRKATQPLDAPSCGSVFKNPKSAGMHAWQVIEKVGLRGFQVGGAQYSEKHCNFIVNRGDAQASDVRALIELAKQKASEMGIELEEEVQYLGF